MSWSLTILGSSAALPTAEKYPTAQVLNASGRLFLIDCGEGTQTRLRKLKISFGKIRHVFISHLHGDHYYGLIGLISTRNLLGLKSDLHIYAHSDLPGLLRPQLDYLKGEMGFRVLFHPLNFKQPAVVYEDKVCEILSFPLNHSVPVSGFLFREKPALPNMIKEKIKELNIPFRDVVNIKAGAGYVTEEGLVYEHHQLTIPPPEPRSYAFCTDTTPHAPASDIIRGVNLLYHEATFLDDMKEWAAKTKHSTARQAAGFALSARAGSLLLGHMSNRYKDPSAFLKEAMEIFPRTGLAEEGKTYRV